MFFYNNIESLNISQRWANSNPIKKGNPLVINLNFLRPNTFELYKGSPPNQFK